MRQSAGLGKVPKERDTDRYEQAYAFCDVLVVGGGIAGLQAALTAGRAGKKVWLMEQTAHWGGRAVVDGVEIDGQPTAGLAGDAPLAGKPSPSTAPPTARIALALVADTGWREALAARLLDAA